MTTICQKIREAMTKAQFSESDLSESRTLSFIKKDLRKANVVLFLDTKDLKKITPCIFVKTQKELERVKSAIKNERDLKLIQFSREENGAIEDESLFAIAVSGNNILYTLQKMFKSLNMTVKETYLSDYDDETGEDWFLTKSEWIALVIKG